MWFFFGIITALAFVIGSLIWRLKVTWKGETIKTNEIEFEFNIIKNKYFPNELYIGTKGIDDIRFKLKAETWYDRLFKLIGVSKEYQTNHPDFDDLVYIASDDSNIHSIISRHPDVSAAILGIFNHPVTPGIKVKEINNYAGKIWIEYKIPREFTDVGILSFAEHPVSNLKSITDTFTGKISQPTARFKDPFVLKAIVILAISSGLAINGLVQFLRLGVVKNSLTVDSSLIWEDAFWIGIAVAIALVAVTLAILKRSSRTHLVVLEICFVGTMGAILTAYVNLHDVNIDFDNSRPEIFETKILAKKINRNRRGRTSYSITTYDWNMEKDKQKFRVSSNFFNRVDVGDRLVVRQRSGYLNYRWVEKFAKKS